MNETADLHTTFARAQTRRIVAEYAALMSNNDNGRKVFDLLRKNEVPSGHHVLLAISHHGVYHERLAEATGLAAAWFQKQPGPR